MINNNHQTQVQYVQEAKLNTTQTNNLKQNPVKGNFSVSYKIGDEAPVALKAPKYENGNLDLEVPSQKILNQNELESVTVNGKEYAIEWCKDPAGTELMQINNCEAFNPNGKNEIIENFAPAKFKPITNVKSGTYNGKQYTNYTLPGSNEIYLDKAYPSILVGGHEINISPSLLSKYNIKSVSFNGTEVLAKNLDINTKTGAIMLKSGVNVQPVNGFHFQVIVNLENKVGESTTKVIEKPMNKTQAAQRSTSAIKVPASQVGSLPNTGIGSSKTKELGIGSAILVFIVGLGGILTFKRRK
ncbi:MAG: hypothetical protein ACRCTZ_07430 [Sarcina sp.]